MSGEASHEGQGLLELGIGLSRKAHYDIRPDGGVRQPASQAARHFKVLRGRVGAPHACEHGVRTALQRQVKVSRHPLARLFDHVEQVRIQLQGFYGAQTQATKWRRPRSPGPAARRLRDPGADSAGRPDVPSPVSLPQLPRSMPVSTISR